MYSQLHLFFLPISLISFLLRLLLKLYSCSHWLALVSKLKIFSSIVSLCCPFFSLLFYCSRSPLSAKRILPLSLVCDEDFPANSSRSIQVMLITDVLRCPKCWRAHVCACSVHLHLSYHSVWFLWCSKIRWQQSTDSMLFENVIFKSKTAVVAISMMLVIYYCDSVSSVYLQARYKAPSLSCTGSCWLNLLSQLVSCRAEIGCWGECYCICRQ